MINVAHIKKRHESNFEEIRGYTELNIQFTCVVFQWQKTQQSLIIPMDLIDYISTSTEKTQ